MAGRKHTPLLHIKENREVLVHPRQVTTRYRCLDDSVPNVVGHELGNCVSKMSLPEQDDALESLLLDRPHESPPAYALQLVRGTASE